MFFEMFKIGDDADVSLSLATKRHHACSSHVVMSCGRHRLQDLSWALSRLTIRVFERTRRPSLSTLGRSFASSEDGR
jgi:hypothetical protein